MYLKVTEYLDWDSHYGDTYRPNIERMELRENVVGTEMKSEKISEKEGSRKLRE